MGGSFVLLFSLVQSVICVRLFVTPWTAARQASLSITNSQSLLKFMSIKSVMPSNHLILYHPLLLLPFIFPSIRVFSKESILRIGQSIEISASASVLPMNIQDCLLYSVQFSSVTQSCTTLCDPMDCSMPDFPVHHQLPELAQIHVN